MWKLRDDIELKELEKHGYEFYADYSNWAKIFYTKIGNWNIEHHIEFIEQDKKLIAIQQVWDDDDGVYLDEEINEEYIQDLIHAGLVEKV